MGKEIIVRSVFTKKYVTIFLALCALVIAACENKGVTEYGQKVNLRVPFGRAYDYSDILVTRVVDGDTLKLENGERLRLIGIDTPEIHESAKLHRDVKRSGNDIRTIKQLGMRSYEFTKRLLEGKRVRLEFDVEKRDKYERLLAYVYLQDGTFANAEIVKEGYADLMTYPPNVKYADLFLQLYRQAREDKRGLWSDA